MKLEYYYFPPFPDRNCCIMDFMNVPYILKCVSGGVGLYGSTAYSHDLVLYRDCGSVPRIAPIIVVCTQ